MKTRNPWLDWFPTKIIQRAKSVCYRNRSFLLDQISFIWTMSAKKKKIIKKIKYKKKNIYIKIDKSNQDLNSVLAEFQYIKENS